MRPFVFFGVLAMATGSVVAAPQMCPCPGGLVSSVSPSTSTLTLTETMTLYSSVSTSVSTSTITEISTVTLQKTISPSFTPSTSTLTETVTVEPVLKTGTVGAYQTPSSQPVTSTILLYSTLTSTETETMTLTTSSYGTVMTPGQSLSFPINSRTANPSVGPTGGTGISYTVLPAGTGSFSAVLPASTFVPTNSMTNVQTVTIYPIPLGTGGTQSYNMPPLTRSFTYAIPSSSSVVIPTPLSAFPNASTVGAQVSSASESSSSRWTSTSTSTTTMTLTSTRTLTETVPSSGAVSPATAAASTGAST